MTRKAALAAVDAAINHQNATTYRILIHLNAISNPLGMLQDNLFQSAREYDGS